MADGFRLRSLGEGLPEMIEIPVALLVGFLAGMYWGTRPAFSLGYLAGKCAGILRMLKIWPK